MPTIQFNLPPSIKPYVRVIATYVHGPATLGLQGAGWANKLKGTRAAKARTRYPHLSEVVIRTIRLKTILKLRSGI